MASNQALCAKLDNSLIEMLNDPQFETLIKNKSPEKNEFYEQYLAKYYPKAFVIRECFFATMTPEDIDKALQSITALFADTPWFYFTNDKQGFKVANYWEYIVDQCSLISDFLKKARVDMATKKVFLLENNLNYLSYGLNFNRMFKGVGVGKLQETKNLLVYLRDVGSTSIYDFYALCFDYENKLFNLGILAKDLKMVNKCYSELTFIVEKLRYSKYEVDYQEHLKTCKELAALLKNKVGNDGAEILEKFFSCDEKVNKMAKESREVGFF